MKECCDEAKPRKIRVWMIALGGVVLVLSVLSFVPDWITAEKPTLESKAQGDIAKILVAVTAFAGNNNGKYPDSIQWLVAPDANGHAYLDGYQGKVPLDPWNRPFEYAPPSPDRPRPHVWSFGADGKKGGFGVNADIDRELLVAKPK